MLKEQSFRNFPWSSIFVSETKLISFSKLNQLKALPQKADIYVCLIHLGIC